MGRGLQPTLSDISSEGGSPGPPKLTGRVRLLCIRLRQILPSDHSFATHPLPENQIDAINFLERLETLLVDICGQQLKEATRPLATQTEQGCTQRGWKTYAKVRRARGVVPYLCTMHSQLQELWSELPVQSQAEQIHNQRCQFLAAQCAIERGLDLNQVLSTSLKLLWQRVTRHWKGLVATHALLCQGPFQH